MLTVIFSRWWNFYVYILFLLLLKKKRLYVVLEQSISLFLAITLSSWILFLLYPYYLSTCEKHINTWKALLFFFFKYDLKFSSAALQLSPVVLSIEVTITAAFMYQKTIHGYVNDTDICTSPYIVAKLLVVVHAVCNLRQMSVPWLSIWIASTLVMVILSEFKSQT